MFFEKNKIKIFADFISAVETETGSESWLNLVASEHQAQTVWG